MENAPQEPANAGVTLALKEALREIIRMHDRRAALVGRLYVVRERTTAKLLASWPDADIEAYHQTMRELGVGDVAG